MLLGRPHPQPLLGGQPLSRPAGSGHQRKGREVGCAESGTERRRSNPVCVPAGLARARGTGRVMGAVQAGTGSWGVDGAGGCGCQLWADVQGQVCWSVTLSSVAFEPFYGLTMIITAECLPCARCCMEINLFSPPDSSEQALLSHALHR